MRVAGPVTTVVVVGAGIVGAAIAHALVKQGHRVRLVDREEPGRGCSYGNSGALSPGSVVPLAMPGVLSSVPRMLLDPGSPLRVVPSYLPSALPWLARFVASARPSHVARSVEALAALHADAVQLHEALARDAGVPELVLRGGHLHLYRDERALAKDATAWRLRAEHGYPAQRLDRDAILALEPAIPARYSTAMYLADHATLRNPFRYVQAIARDVVRRGGEVVRAEVTAIERRGARWSVASRERRESCDAVVVACGAWSRGLLATQGLDLPLETQRGYHVEYDGPAPIARTVVLTDLKAFLAPMETGLRVGGTVEIGGLAAAPDWRRADALARAMAARFPEIGTPARRWMGHRPCLPDSVPFVGRVPGQPGLYAAVGHGHLGLTDAPGSALRIAAWIADDAAALAHPPRPREGHTPAPADVS